MRNMMEDVNKELGNMKAYDEAEAANDEQRKKDAIVAHMELDEEVEAEGEDYRRIFKKMIDAAERGNEFIDLDECIWEKNIKPLVDSFRKYGVSKFTMSSTWSGAVETAWLFTTNGCKLEGIVEINGIHKNFRTGVYEKNHAFVFTVA